MKNEAEDFINIPPKVYDLVNESLGHYFSKISLMNPDDLTKDMLNPAKAIHNKQVLSKYVNLEGKKYWKWVPGMELIWLLGLNASGWM